MDKNEERIKVAMRCRPLISGENKENSKEIIFVDKGRKEVILGDPSDKKKKPVVFTYDFVYDKSSS